MWIGVLWAGVWVAMWIIHVGGKFRHGLLEKPLIIYGVTDTDLALLISQKNGYRHVIRSYCRKLRIPEAHLGCL